MPLHLDYRPTTFDEIVGNKGVVESHKAIFQRESDFPRAVLYIGQRGCGKTSLAYIYANMLGADKRDIKEHDAGSGGKVADAKDIVEMAQYKPLGGSVKVFIIEEIGESTPQFQTALLRTLENKKLDYVYFLGTTTNPQKLSPAFRSRFMPFEVSLLNDSQMMELLKRVLRAEKCEEIPDSVLSEIIKITDGCPREALVTLDQIIDLPIESMLGAIQDLRVTEKTVKNLCQTLLKKEPWKKVASVLRDVDMSDAEGVRRTVLGYMSSVLLKGEDNPQAAIIMEFFREPTYNSGKSGLVWASYQSII